MRTTIRTLSLFLGVIVALLGVATGARGAGPDWKAVEAALGTSGGGLDAPARLAHGLKAALDQTNSQW